MARGRPPEDERFDPMALVARVLMSRRVRGLIPTSAALALARARGRLRWLWLPARRRAIGRVSLTVAGTHREQEAVALARDELIIGSMRNTLRWRTWATGNIPFSGSEHLDAALASGRPVILTRMHTGWGVSHYLVLAQHGYSDLNVVTGFWFAPGATAPRGRVGYTLRFMHRVATDLGVRVIPGGGAYPMLRRALEQRRLLMLVADTPGTTATRMAGKNAYLRSGLARLAHETGALVVPLVTLLERRGPSVEILEPIDAAEASDHQEVLDRIAAVYGDLIVRHPASLEPMGWATHIWRDEGGAYPQELWQPPKLHDRARRLRKRATGTVRRRLRALRG